MPIVTPTFALLLLTASSATLHAQDRPPRRQDEPKFDDAPAGRGEPAAPPQAKSPAEAIDAAFATGVTWPADSGENALRALIARGPELAPWLRARLEGGTVLERAAAARALCLLGEKEAFPAIERLLADARQRPRWAALLESLVELEPSLGRALAMRCLAADDGALRQAAVRTLETDPDPLLSDALVEQLLAADRDAVRFDLFGLLEARRDPRLAELAIEHFLGDPQPRLAARVTHYLGRQLAPEVRESLARAALADRSRRGLHAVLALALAEHETGLALLPEELFPALLPSLSTSDPLLRAVACTACATIAYRDERHDVALREEILPALADVVIHGRFFGDFEVCFRAAVGALELITCERLGPSIPAWRAHFERTGGAAIEPRRELDRIELGRDADGAVVTLERQDAAGRFEALDVLAGPGHRVGVALGQRPGWIALERRAMEELLLGLEKDGVLTADLPRALPEAVDGALRLTIATEGRERRAMIAPDRDLFARVAERVELAAREERWQVLLDPAESWSRRYSEEQAWFSTHVDPAERTGRLVDLALARIAGGDAEGTRRAFAVIGGVERLGESVRASQIDALAALLAGMSLHDPRARRVFDLLVKTGRPDAFDRLADALAPRGPSGSAWIEDALVEFGAAARGVDDPRPAVRAAALRALPRTEDAPVPTSRLAELASADADERVRQAALEALRGRDEPLAQQSILALATAGSGPVRLDALRAAGGLRTPEALQCLVETARKDASFATAALEGLALRGDADAAMALDAIARERGAADPVGRLALAAIKRLPRELALDRLQALSREAGGELAREAACGLADLGEMVAVPALLADLEDPGRARRAVTLLTYLFCKDLGTEPWRFRSLHESQPGSTHADWFLSALAESGGRLPENAGVLDRAMIPHLIAAIEDSRWFVRRSAVEFLERTTGFEVGQPAVNATREEITELARRWREATGAQAGGSEQR